MKTRTNNYPMATRLYRKPLNHAKNSEWITERYHYAEAKLATERGRPYCKHSAGYVTFVAD